LWFHEDGKLRQNLPQKPVVGGEMPHVPSADSFPDDKEHQVLMKTDTADGAVIRLNGETVSVEKPISLEPGEYLIIGPGRLDADFSGPSNAVVRIKGCVFNNMTSVGYQKNRINYIIEDGAYLNFVNLEDDIRIRKCIKHSDGLSNGNSGDVEFNGPLTREELRKVRRDRRKRQWQKELEEINAFRHDDSHTRIF
jgi:hypothetical protein